MGSEMGTNDSGRRYEGIYLPTILLEGLWDNLRQKGKLVDTRDVSRILEAAIHASKSCW
jgi:hypothetical protein